MKSFDLYIEYSAKFVEFIGVSILIFGVIYSLGKYLLQLRQSEKMSYSQVRNLLGRYILLGLEVLIAADIIATVVTDPTLSSVASLGLIVLIRTFLSFAIDVELEGKLPWKRKRSD